MAQTLTEPALHEDWYPYSSQLALIRAVKRSGVTDHAIMAEGLIVEIGCWEGRSTCLLANVIAPRTLVAIDTWRGSAGDESGWLVNERDVYTQFIANINAWTEGNVIPHVMDWREYRNEPWPVDVHPVHKGVQFLHIDGEHTYEEVSETIRAFAPLMKPYGVMCGDDATSKDVLAAAHDMLGKARVKVEADTLWWTQF